MALGAIRPLLALGAFGGTFRRTLAPLGPFGAVRTFGAMLAASGAGLVAARLVAAWRGSWGGFGRSGGFRRRLDLGGLRFGPLRAGGALAALAARTLARA